MDPVSVVQAVMAAQEAKDIAKVRSLLTDDFTFSGPVPEPVGKEQYLGLQAALIQALPDWKFNAKNLKAQGNVVTGTAQITGTHTGTLHRLMSGMPDVPPTGKRVSLPQESFTATVRGDQIASFEVSSSPGGGVMGILQQIGAPMSG